MWMPVFVQGNIFCKNALVQNVDHMKLDRIMFHNIVIMAKVDVFHNDD